MSIQQGKPPFNLLEFKKYREKLEIIFDCEGKLDPDELLGRFDELIEMVGHQQELHRLNRDIPMERKP